MKINDVFENNGNTYKVVGMKFKPCFLNRKARIQCGASSFHPICLDITERSPKSIARKNERERNKPIVPLNRITLTRMWMSHHHLISHTSDRVSKRYEQMDIRWKARMCSHLSGLHNFL